MTAVGPAVHYDCLSSPCPLRPRDTLACCWDVKQPTDKQPPAHWYRNATYIVMLHTSSRYMHSHATYIVMLHTSSRYLHRHATCIVKLHTSSRHMHRQATYVVTLHTSSRYIHRHATYIVTLHTSSRYIHRQATYIVKPHTSSNYIHRQATYIAKLHASFSYIHRQATYIVRLHTLFSYIHRHATCIAMLHAVKKHKSTIVQKQKPSCSLPPYCRLQIMTQAGCRLAFSSHTKWNHWLAGAYTLAPNRASSAKTQCHWQKQQHHCYG